MGPCSVASAGEQSDAASNFSVFGQNETKGNSDNPALYHGSSYTPVPSVRTCVYESQEVLGLELGG